MAIDSALKRKSIAGIPGAWMPISLEVGTLGNPERQAIGWSYSGITAGAPSAKIGAEMTRSSGATKRLTIAVG